MSKVINFISGPGCGKTVMSALVFAELKMMHKSVEIVPEIAKWLIYKENFDKLNDQQYVSGMQYQQVKVLDGKVDYIVADSGIITGLYYNKTFKTNSSDVLKTQNTILKHNGEFDNIYIYLERNLEFQFQKEGRVHDEDESKIIDKELKYMLDEHGLKYKTFKSDRKSVKDIINYILEF